MTATDLPTVACEPGKTGGWLLQAPAAFFRRFKGHDAPRNLRCAPEKQHIFATQVWLVTWQRPNGDIQTNAVLISGVWQMAEIETQARDALHRQCDITDVQILRLSLDFNTTPARLEALQRITDEYQSRTRFEEGCG
jgi:hypothetical protein